MQAAAFRPSLGEMDFFVHSRDAPDAGPLRDDLELLEAHWSYTDAFAETMIARGPTLADDRDTATGSLHVLGLPSVEAARAFVAGEPNNRAGLYDQHRIWRFENLLGRTMWEFPAASDEPKFLVVVPQHEILPPERLSKDLRERLILYGALTALDDQAPSAVALAVQARDREVVVALLEELVAVAEIEIHDWEFGGRR